MQEHKLTIGFSPCPNDTFIFDAMVHGKIDTEGLTFEVLMADVEELNRRAFAGELQVSKLSLSAFLQLADKYLLLDAGAALGFGAGPLFISKRKYQAEEFKNLRIAIPGKHTTANLLFSIAYPNVTNKTEMVFSEIENAVLTGQMDAGLIIHEGRFTYADKGLVKLQDLGEYWEKLTHSPIPLGGIAVRKDIDLQIAGKLNRVIRKSVEYSLARKQVISEFVKCNAQELSAEVMRQHIDLYVNEFSVSLGETGRKAISLLMEKVTEIGWIDRKSENIFSNEVG